MGGVLVDLFNVILTLQRAYKSLLLSVEGVLPIPLDKYHRVDMGGVEMVYCHRMIQLGLWEVVGGAAPSNCEERM